MWFYTTRSFRVKVAAPIPRVMGSSDYGDMFLPPHLRFKRVVQKSDTDDSKLTLKAFCKYSLSFVNVIKQVLRTSQQKLCHPKSRGSNRLGNTQKKRMA